MPRFLPLLAIAVIAQSGCTSSSDSAPETGPGGVRNVPASGRRTPTVTLDSLWRITPSDSGAIVEPVFVAAGWGRVFVSDAVAGLVALDASGQREWPVPNARGAGRFGQAFGALTLRRDSTIVMTERSGTRLLRARVTGRGVDQVVLDRRWNPNAICAPTDSTLLLTMGEAPLGVVDGDGREVGRPPYPWLAMRDSSLILQQTVVASSPTATGCLVAQAFGGGFAITDDGNQFRVFETPETVALPGVVETIDSTATSITRSTRLVEPVLAAVQAAVTDTLAIIAFGGATPVREGLIDLYDRRTGAYLGSAKLGAPVRALAAAGDTLFVLHRFEGRVALTAWRLSVAGGRDR